MTYMVFCNGEGLFGDRLFACREFISQNIQKRTCRDYYSEIICKKENWRRECSQRINKKFTESAERF